MLNSVQLICMVGTMTTAGKSFSACRNVAAASQVPYTAMSGQMLDSLLSRAVQPQQCHKESDEAMWAVITMTRRCPYACRHLAAICMKAGGTALMLLLVALPSNEWKCVHVVQCEGDIPAMLPFGQQGMSWALSEHKLVHLKASPIGLSPRATTSTLPCAGKLG